MEKPALKLKIEYEKIYLCCKNSILEKDINIASTLYLAPFQYLLIEVVGARIIEYSVILFTTIQIVKIAICFSISLMFSYKMPSLVYVYCILPVNNCGLYVSRHTVVCRVAQEAGAQHP